MPLPILSLFGLAAATAAAGAARLLGRRRGRRVEAALGERFSMGEGGIIRGAEGFALERPGAPAVLLLHGAGDTPASMRYFAEALHAMGYAVSVPLLPGHGRAVREFQSVDADTLLEAARESLRRLVDRHAWVAVAGLSMGGALAIRLAADGVHGRAIRALVLLAPYIVPPTHVRIAAMTAAAWRPFVPYVDTADPRSIHDQAERARALGYGVMTPSALRALVATARAAHAELPRIQCPTLLVLSRHDNRVAEPAARRAFERIGAVEKQLVVREVGGHILPVDHGREAVFDTAVAWLEAHRGAATTAGEGVR